MPKIFDIGTHLIEFAYYITPDNVQYSLFGGKRVLMSWRDIGMPPINYIQDRGPFQHGVTVRDFRLNPRVITLEQFERGCERIDFYCHLANLIAAIRPNRSSTVKGGKLLFIRPDNVEVEIGARILEGPTGDWDGEGSILPSDYREQLRFFCEDPVWRLPTSASVTFSLSTSGSCLDDCLDFCLDNISLIGSSSIAYSGTWEGDQIDIVITGPLSTPIITNETTGQSIVLNYQIATGEIVTISIQPNLVTVTNNLGVNLIGTVDNISDLVTFSLVTIGNQTSTGVNTISVIGTNGTGGVTQVTFTYFTRHISAFAPC